ncbi:EAL domain-containing protein [Parasalinivibrio latis]|uniref:EAL domain-containing protein n=1 Tax=Parasalinivibrio latis TaxID=2952610 RepID=UPI0030E56D9C
MDLLDSQEDFELFLTEDQVGNVEAIYGSYRLSSVYQPLFTRDGEIYGYEALVRIRSLETLQYISPEIIFSAPNNQDDYGIDQVNLDRLSRVIHLRNFARLNKSEAIFLNILPTTAVMQSLSPTGQKLMRKRLVELGMPNNQVVFEVTEQECGNDDDLAVAIDHSKLHGFRIAIDDYGSEANNESRLRKINPCIVKIDRGLLVKYMLGQQIPLLDAISNAKNIGAKIVVEGIETEHDFQAMLALDIDLFQGYYLGLPKPLMEEIIPVKAASLPI